jgi:heptosyltransferase III
MRLLFLTATRLGDAILSTAVLRSWLEAYPHGRVVVACGAVPAPLFAACPSVEDVWMIRKQTYHRHWWTLWKKAIGQRWDAVIDLRASAFAYTVRTSTRVVFQPSSRLSGLHKIHQFQQAFGWKETISPALWWTTDHEQQAAMLLPTSDAPWLAIGATANWAGKQWPADRFAALAQQLQSGNSPLAGARIALFAAPNEQEQLRPLLNALPQAVNLTGKAELPVLAACLKRCRLYVGNDSGLMHLAAAACTPTLGLFGPSDERVYAPWGEQTAWVRTPESLLELTSSPHYNHRTTGTLMESLSVERALDAAHQLLLSSSAGGKP